MATKAAGTTPAKAQTVPADTAVDNEKAARQKAIEKAKYQATATVVADNKAAWNGLVQTALAEQGIDWRPPLSAEEKAQAEFDRLLAEHPSLAQRLAIPGEQAIPSPDGF